MHKAARSLAGQIERLVRHGTKSLLNHNELSQEFYTNDPIAQLFPKRLPADKYDRGFCFLAFHLSFV